MKSAPRDRIVIKTSRLLPVLITLVVPFEVAAKDPIAPPSVSCRGPEGERYLQSLLDRIHQLETQLDAEVEAHLTERADAERRLRDVTNELTQQAAAALAPAKQPTQVQSFDPERAKKELAALKAALDEATAARRRAEAEAAAASQTAATFANALKEVEGRLAAAEKKIASAAVSRMDDAEAAAVKSEPASQPPEATVNVAAAEPSPTKPPAVLSAGERPAPPPTAEPRVDARAAAILPTPTPAALSESEVAAVELAALSGRRAAPALHDARLVTAPSMPEPNPSVQTVKPIETTASGAASERDRAAAQLAALTGKTGASFAIPAPPPVARKTVETTSAPATPPLASIAAPPAKTRCDEPLENARIEPGDRLAIHVDHLREVSDTVEVGSDGRVHLPLVGTVAAAGRNQREFVADLTQRLTVYLQAPHVDVALKRDCGR